jgi:hypothetical protein
MFMEENIIVQRKRFPTLAIALLVVGLIWLLNDLNVVSINIPWIPIIIIIIAIGMMFNRFIYKW